MFGQCEHTLPSDLEDSSSICCLLQERVTLDAISIAAVYVEFSEVSFWFKLFDVISDEGG